MIKCLSSPQKQIQTCVFALDTLFTKNVNEQMDLSNLVFINIFCF